MKSRLVLLFILLTILWGAMLTRAAYLQIWPNERLRALQKRQFETVVTLRSRRGDVTDRNGHELAVSMTAYSLFADPKLIEDPVHVARMLARELSMPPLPLLQKLRTRHSRFVWLQRRLDKPLHDAIEKHKIRGLGFIEETKRTYPNDHLLAHVLGFIGSEGRGLEGLEAQLNDSLEGTNKKVNLQRDARGRPLIVNGQLFTEEPDGADVQLTIDRELQFNLEQELQAVVAEQHADYATGVILDAQTSEVLAMANAPTFYPDKPGAVAAEWRRNRTVTDAFEPGSTMKTFLIAGAMSRGLVQPNTKFDLGNGTLRIGNRTIHEADAHHVFSSLTVSDILMYSSNVGAAKIGLKLGDQALRETLLNFGFGEKTGIDLPGESHGILQPLPWREHLLANVAFGQGMSSTPLQIANAYAAVANGGLLHKPYIVRRIRDYDTNETTETQMHVVRRVLSAEQASKMRLLLMGVTSKDGTGFNARVSGFPVAGKTGTAQKADPNGRGYKKNSYVSSFAGFLPANDPKFVIYIAVDNPRKDFYGAAVAAPVFARVAKFAVRAAGLAPVLFDKDNMAQTFASSFSKNLLGGAVAGAEPRTPAPLVSSVLPGSVSSAGVVPDLAGLSVREALLRVGGLGIELSVKGSGFITHTQPSVGESLAGKKQLTVFLSPNSTSL
jgi:cell division protein FtsI (penicillin-binding protein 3)